jgi:hypothetical protein
MCVCVCVFCFCLFVFFFFFFFFLFGFCRFWFVGRSGPRHSHGQVQSRLGHKVPRGCLHCPSAQKEKKLKKKIKKNIKKTFKSSKMVINNNNFNFF